RVHARDVVVFDPKMARRKLADLDDILGQRLLTEKLVTFVDPEGNGDLHVTLRHLRLHLLASRRPRRAVRSCTTATRRCVNTTLGAFAMTTVEVRGSPRTSTFRE